MVGPGGTQSEWCSQLRPALGLSNLASSAVAGGQSLAQLPSERAWLWPHLSSGFRPPCQLFWLGLPGHLRTCSVQGLRFPYDWLWGEWPSSRAPLAKPSRAVPPRLAACPPWDKKEAWPGLA